MLSPVAALYVLAPPKILVPGELSEEGRGAATEALARVRKRKAVE